MISSSGVPVKLFRIGFEDTGRVRAAGGIVFGFRGCAAGVS